MVDSGNGPDAEKVRCSCRAAGDKEKRTRHLLNMDGLTEAERRKRFADMMNIYDNDVLAEVQQAVRDGKGLITLMGSFGVGKSTMLICAVNAGRESNRLSIYTTMADLLSYLRSTFGSDADESFDKYWNALVRADILAIDELDEFNDTGWAVERFLRLMDERWRRMDEVLTLFALNGRLNGLHGKVRSRLTDGRAKPIEVNGKDMRGINEW